MEIARLKSSDIGRAVAEQMKAKGKTLAELEEAYAVKKFGRSFVGLADEEKNATWVEIIEASGRVRPSATAGALRMGKFGKGLLFISMAIAIADIATSEDKVEAAGREGTGFLAGAAGAAGTAAAVGWIAGPGYSVVVGVAAFVGGALAAWGGDAASKELAQDGHGIERATRRNSEFLSYVVARSRALCAFEWFYHRKD
ncbi:MAG: hypothetical protein WA324_01650 [Bryobacteraceae bacterium]